MAHALIITASLNSGLTYEDHDIIQILDGHKNPGSSVTPRDSGFSFCYVSDKEHDDPELLELMGPLTAEKKPEEEEEGEKEQLKKREYCLPLIDEKYKTWVADDKAAAAGIEMTWAEVQDLLVKKKKKQKTKTKD